MLGPDQRTNVNRKRVLVVGLGLHGGAASAVRWFRRHHALLRVQDIKRPSQLVGTVRKLGHRGITYHFGGHPAADFRWADIIYVNQGVPMTLPPLRASQRRGIPLLNETTLFFEHCPCPIIGVTGTRGKTTTTTIIGDIIARAKRKSVVAGNIRTTPMLDVVDRLRSNQVAVLELSSFQLEYLPLIRTSPHIAVFTNLNVDHLNRYRGMHDYASAKENILRFQHADDFAVLNAENPWTRKAATLTAGSVWWFQLHGRRGIHGITVIGDWIVEYHGRTTSNVMRCSTIRARGQHNLQNILAAIAATRALGISVSIIRQAVNTFQGIPYRQEYLRTWRGHRFINDTAATSPDGALAALKVYPDGLFLFGGTDKQLEFRPLAQWIARHQTPAVFLPGTATEKLLRLLKRYGYRRPIINAHSMTSAVQAAVVLAQPRQTIVLSPGAASFGLFEHEFDRGDQYTKVVRHLV